MDRIETLKVIHADLLRDAGRSFSVDEEPLGRTLMNIAGFVRSKIDIEEVQGVLGEIVEIRTGLK